jgi:hypothetical protein
VVFATRLRMIGSSLDPHRYGDARFVAERLYRMTTGRRRIEVSAAELEPLTGVLTEFAPGIAADAPDVVASIRRAVPNPHRRG